VGQGGAGEDDKNCMKDKRPKYQRAFIPSDPQDQYRTQLEVMNWRAELDAEKKKDRRNAILGWITAISAVIAALAAVAGVVIQLVSK